MPHSRLNFSLTQLEYALAVHRFGHFAKAARHCAVTQPTLSMQLRKLEEQLGTVLFDRSKKPILLTEKGKKLISQMQSVLFEAKKIESLLQADGAGRFQGELTLGIIPTVAPYLLPRLLPTLENLYPDLNLRILELQTHRIVEALNEDEIDVGILATPLKIPRVHERPLYWEPFSVLCKKDHALSRLKRVKYSSLKPDDIWLLEEGHCLRHQILDVCSLKHSKGLKRRFQFESGSLETLKRLVNSYGGYTLLPYLATEDLGSKVTLVDFERPIPAREVGLVTRREDHKKDLLDALAEGVLKSLPKELRQIRQKDLDTLPVG